MNFNQFFENNLNPEQKKAVAQKNGPLLVIAGAGSGKTRVITSRIVNLLVNENVPPHSIIALTFTNKAALEMKERIVHFLGVAAPKPFIGTFHSYCLYLMRTNMHYMPFAQFTIMDGDDQQQLLQSLIKKNGLQKKISAKNLGYQISIKKNSTLQEQTISYDPLFMELYTAYEREKALSKSYDFDDLLLEILKLFNNNPIFKEQFQHRIRHILVDEYQDTNVIQHALLKHMALADNKFIVDSLCAVGDEDQSIYSWRGATVANIMHFKKDFPETIFIKIEQNYRSVQPILEIANHVIQHNQQRNPKKLWSDRQATNRACMVTCLSGYQEGEIIAQSLKSLQRKNKQNSLAILYRAHYQSRIIEEALLRHSIAYKIIGGIQFYERKEIKDILAFLRLMVNPFDRVSFFRVFNTPARGLGEKCEQELQALWDQQPLFDFHDLINHAIKESLMTGKRAQQLKEFCSLFKGMDHTAKTSSAITHIIMMTQYYTYLKDSYDPQDAESKIENIKELHRAATYWEERSRENIALFLQEIALMQEKINDQSSETNHINLMTLHSAKGLEFDAIVLSGLEEGIFPSMHALESAESIEEERRLFYVGITRAKEHLLITHSRYRYTYGSMTDQRPSRFLREIPEHLIEKNDGSSWTTFDAQNYFNRRYGNSAPQSTVMTFGTTPKIAPTIPKPATASSVIKSALIEPKKISSSTFKKSQTVKHEKFGIGIVQTIEQKGDDTTYITARFKQGIKKIKAEFLDSL